MPVQLPSGLLQALQPVSGFNRERFEAVHASGEQVTSVRLNPAKYPLVQNGELFPGIPASPIPWCAEGLYLDRRPFFTFDPLLHAGVYYVQEASSMFLAHALQQVAADTAGKRVLDLCAAPGGKSSLLAAHFCDGLVVSNEVIRARSAILVENLVKWGAANKVVTQNDPKDFRLLEGYFDVVLVDAPCSGSGLFRRDPSAIAEWSEENVLLCSHRQQRILADVLPALKQDGVLIYSTCSYSAEEDEAILDWLVQSFPLQHLPIALPEKWNIVATQAPLTGAEGYRFYPDQLKGEGFFMAAFRKTEGGVFNGRKGQLPAASRKEAAMAAPWVQPGLPLYFFLQQQHLLAVPEIWQADIALLQQHLYLRKAGVNIGALKGKDLVPAHELALSLLLHPGIPRSALQLEEALQYLRKKELRTGDTHKGWVLSTYQGVPLGWMKLLPNRVNNYYPTEWRIIKE